ncbi:hypothetical protein MOD33_11215 [Bacillus spizizenii]|nr:hypothetical protein [Bacillus spizizenii]MCY8781488.1 hypothetical protein [Bacillus spizizenii]MCY8896357.1 hypothetical protein [Bacillus spizizenii]
MNVLQQIDWKAFGSVIVAFGAAATAQFIAHIFSQRREDIKYKKECLQNLYSPVIIKINKYLFEECIKESTIKQQGLEFYNNEFKNPSDNPHNTFKDILETVGSNLKYARPDIIMKYHDLVSMPIENQNEKDWFVTSRIDFCNVFLLDYLHLSKELKVNSSKINTNVEKSLVFTQLHQLLENTGHLYSQESLIRHYLEITKLRQYLNRIMKLNRKFEKNFSLLNKEKAEKIYKQIGESFRSDVAEWWFSNLSRPDGFLDEAIDNLKREMNF